MSDYNAIVALYEALEESQDDEQPEDFLSWVEEFGIPRDTGMCRIEATCDQANEEYDYFIYYLVGEDCNGQDFTIRFRKGVDYWASYTLEYEGDMTTKTF